MEIFVAKLGLKIGYHSYQGAKSCSQENDPDRPYRVKTLDQTFPDQEPDEGALQGIRSPGYQSKNVEQGKG